VWFQERQRVGPHLFRQHHDWLAECAAAPPHLKLCRSKNSTGATVQMPALFTSSCSPAPCTDAATSCCAAATLSCLYT
jgi:hypothetical protein